MRRANQWIQTHIEDIHYEKFSQELQKKYPISYKAFLEKYIRSDDYLFQTDLFFKEYGIKMDCYLSDSIKYQGTYTATIKIFKESSLKKLKRTSRSLSYPYHSTFDSAMRKGLFKGHQVVSHLIQDLPWP